MKLSSGGIKMRHKKLYARKLFLVSAFLCFLNQANLKAVTLLVDNDGSAAFNNIQGAVDAASNGDEIVILTGTYTGTGNRDIDFKGKAITVRGSDPNDPNVIAATIISCDATSSNQHRAFYFHSSETNNSVLNGLTITKGYAYGGAIRSEAGSNPTIKNCVFTLNAAPYSSGIGGAIYTAGNCRILNCTFKSNSAYRGGGAIGVEQASPEIDGCSFNLNTTSFGWGGAIYIGISGTPIIKNCSIKDNTATGSRASGGGIYCAANATLELCELISNNSSVKGGAILCKGGTVTLNRCVLQSNSSPTGGAIHSTGTVLKITDTLIVRNSATSAGGIFGSEYCSLSVLNSTLADNAHCAIYCDGIGASVSNSIIWANVSEILVQNTAYGTGSCTASYSDVKNGYSGVGNISSDPCFINHSDGNYHLSTDSPCHNGGNPIYVPFLDETDIDGEDRVQDGIVDIGADESTFDAAILQAIPTECEFVFEDGQITPLSNAVSIRNLGSGVITWQITEDCPWLEISSLSGQCGHDPIQVYFSIDNTKIPAGGTYSTVVTISAAETGNSPQNITVRLKVRSNTIIEVPAGSPNIQDAINVALPGATIVLSPGTYSGPGNVMLNFDGKGLTLRSTDPCDPSIVASTIIDCMNSSRAIGFNVETSPPVVSGLTFINGNGNYAGGAISCNMTDAKVSRCVFKNCTALENGGAIWVDSQSDMIIEFCTFVNNTCGDGGAISAFNNNLVIKNCVFKNNSAGHDGGAISIQSCQPTIADCVFISNLAVRGGGVALNDCPSSLVANCTLTANRGGAKGGAVFVGGGAGMLRNCVLWNDKSYNGPEVYRESTQFDIASSNVQGYWEGIGNINADPCFIDPANGNYHLSNNSPCINAADSTYVTSPFDTDGLCRVVNGRQDMGAYENQSQGPIIDLPETVIAFHTYTDQNDCSSKNLIIANRGTGIMDWTINSSSCPWLIISPNSGQLNENQTVTLGIDIQGMHAGVYYGDILVYSNNAINSPMIVRVFLHISEPGDGLHVPSEYPTIQSAINDSNDGERIIVAPGTYKGDGNRDIDFSGKKIAVISIDANDPNVIVATVLDCQGTAASPHRGFNFHSFEIGTSLIGGLSVINGYIATNGGAINCDQSSPTVFNCRFSNCYAAARGGAIYCYSSNAQIKNCTMVSNLSELSGGALYVRSGNPYIFGCAFVKNQARSYGGGLYSATSNAIVRNCVFTDNIAPEESGTMYSSAITLEGTLIINNCIIWSYDLITGEIHYATGSAPVVSYSDVRGGFGGTGNINTDPKFQDVSAGNFHLKDDSPCINSGDPGYGPGFGITDLDGEPRMMDGRTDMGVDEMTGTFTPIIDILPQKLDYTAFEGKGNPDPQILTLGNAGYGILNWNITVDSNWLNVTPITGQSEREQSGIVVNVNVSGLCKSLSVGNITIEAPGSWNSPQSIPVTLRLIRTIVVPSECSTIQSAIDAAMDGDSITIEPNTYSGPGNCDLDFKNKKLVVRSLNPNDPNIVASTVIDCKGSQVSPHRAFYFHSGEDANSIVTGLTIVNGYQTDGAGILVDNSHPLITRCTFINCTAQNWGGGVYCYNSSAHITDCNFCANTGHEGGAITTRGSGVPIIERCNIQANTAFSAGAGINSDCLSSPQIVNCIIAGNHAPAGGALSIFQSNPAITNCTIADNSSTSDGSQIIQYYEYGGGSNLTNCIIWSSLDQPYPLITLYSHSTMTLAYTDLQYLAAGITRSSDSIVNLSWGNIDVDPAFARHGYWASVDNPNIEMPPAVPGAKWISGDYHLKSEVGRWDPCTNIRVSDTVTSRCIDAGNPGTLLRNEPMSIILNSHSTSVTNSRVDMGAYGGTEQASIGPTGWASVADLNNDGTVSGNDFAILAASWLQTDFELSADFSHDSTVDFYDTIVFAQNWLSTTSWYISP